MAGAGRKRNTISLAARAVVAAALLAAGALHAESESEPERGQGEQLDEITVLGQRSLGALRLQVEAARERVYDAFNQLNSNDEFDIRCYNVARLGTRVPQRVCRPRYAENASREAATEILDACRPEPICELGISRGQAAQGQAYHKDQLLAGEFERVTREHPEFRRAVADYQELERQYEYARRGPPAVRTSIVRVR